MQHHYYTYIMCSESGTLYIGMTNNLERRVYQHKTKSNPVSFTARYDVNKLVWYEVFSQVEDAISAEKRLKGKSRKYKQDLIRNDNPRFMDLSADWEQVTLRVSQRCH